MVGRAGVHACRPGACQAPASSARDGGSLAASALLLLDRAVQELIGRTIRLTDVFCRPEIERNQVTIEGTQHDAAA